MQRDQLRRISRVLRIWSSNGKMADVYRFVCKMSFFVMVYPR